MSGLINLTPCAAHIISVHYSDPDYKASTDEQEGLCEEIWKRYSYHQRLVEALRNMIKPNGGLQVDIVAALDVLEDLGELP